MSRRLDFIDVSKWQGVIDWETVAEHPTLIGAIAKATEGTSIFDSQYLANRAGALDAGLAFASYHYLHAADPEGQVAWYLEKAEPRSGERVVLDYEEQDPPVTMAALEAAVFAIRRDRPDLQITIYGASKLTDDCLACQDVAFLTETSLWIARYSNNKPAIADPPWSYWTAWQWTDEGGIDGVDGQVDLNTFNGSPKACREWFGPVKELPGPQPVESTVTVVKAYGREVTVQVEADGTVSFWVDGEPWS